MNSFAKKNVHINLKKDVLYLLSCFNFYLNFDWLII